MKPHDLFAKDATRRALAIAVLAALAGVALGTLPAAAQDNKPDASMAAKVSLAGVRPGMSKAEAIAAIKAFDPQLVVVEGYTSFGNGMRYTAPRFSFKPASTAYFSTLIVIERSEVMRGRPGPVTERDLRTYASPSTFGIPECHPGALVKQPREKVSYHVEFSAVLNDPRVVLVDEQRVFCGHDVTVTSAIERLYQRYSRNVTRSLRIREDGLRVTQDTYPSVGTGGAFLEWRYTAAMGGMGLRNQVDMPLMDANGNYAGLGNASGGIAVHAEIRPTQDLAYMDSLRTLLWDDGAIAREARRKTSLYSELDRLGITVDQLGNRQLTDQVRLDEPAGLTGSAPPGNR